MTDGGSLLRLSGPLGRDPVHTSESLHARVRRFAELALAPPLVPPPGADTFESLAKDIALYQLVQRPELAQLAKPTPLGGLTLPAVPVEVFRLGRVAVHAPEHDVARFLTSGTTQREAGMHAMRTLATYDALTLALARRTLFSKHSRGVVLAAASAPEPGVLPASSLGYMMRRFMETFDGRALSAEPQGASYEGTEPQRWLVERGTLNLERLRRGARIARQRSEPLFLLGTSFALAALVEELDGETLGTPRDTFVMTTGGFKGRSVELSAAELRREIARTLGTAEAHVLGEYGMTELTSQLWEKWGSDGRQGHYFAPPWLSVTAVDPSTFEPVAPGEEGVARFIDLGNVDSLLSVVTEDRIREVDGGIELLGRLPRADARGCSLPYEGLVGPGSLSKVDTTPRAKRSGRALRSVPPPDIPRRAPQTENLEERQRLLHALERAALDIQRPDSSLGRRARALLPESTGLSPEGIEYALGECFEAGAGRAALHQLCRAAPAAPRAWVQLSANVFTGAYRAIALALASSTQVIVRASRRERVFAELLHEASGGSFELEDELAPTPGDHVWAYGSDETLLSLANQLPSGVHLHAHGAGMGVVVLREPSHYDDAHLSHAADALAQDTIAFDQRGCLSPRLVLVEGSPDFRQRFARATAEALGAWERTVPRGRITGLDLAEVNRFEHVARFCFQTLAAGRGLVTLAAEPEQLYVPPPGRYLHFVETESALDALTQLAPKLTTVSFFHPEHLPGLCHERFGARRYVGLGQMQRPPLDGPVDVRAGFSSTVL